ncbi:hypothetical protein J2W56_006683 [Nocardia kruczakiae]|uniref:Uncharacterized protein n=1 Tax=Nocardia kruczakiae TaxID=261477 RepID=A0ABU1XSG0_9NOCA|nr:hypothetical protein [Nocardia kruczakiae]MDR7172917.1 hypothetical protein [Nocardia kruczakiae]
MAISTRPHADNRAASYYGIDRSQPQWLVGRAAIESTHGQRVRELIGKRLTRSWLVRDQDDEWFADCPVVPDFEGEQVEINHQKFEVPPLIRRADYLVPAGTC